MKRIIKIVPLGLAGWLAGPATPARAQVIDILHTFTGGASDGQSPEGALFQSGSTLYAMTYGGGNFGDGTIFKLGTDGTGYGVLRSFQGGASDGRNPTGSLIQLGQILYGVTPAGGAGSGGVAFQMQPDGTGLGLTHPFPAFTGDGYEPYGSIVQSGGALFGITSAGGSANLGAIFRMNPDGSGYTILHSFAGGTTDGEAPLYATPLVSGSTLYGMAFRGGTSNFGTIFRINTDGTGYTTLHSFTGGSNDGEIAYGSLTLVGTTLYGTTGFGGTANLGTIFKIGVDGSGFAVIHSFAGGPADGYGPEGDLLPVGSKLYGTTPYGGSDALGTLFGINTDGTDFDVLHSFIGGAGDGAGPQGDLLLVGSALDGMTSIGGSSDLGTVFSFPISVPEPSTLALAAVGGATALLARWRPRARGDRLPHSNGGGR